MNVAQETLGFRRAGLSPALSLLMSAFALPIPPATLTSHLRRRRERSSTTAAIPSRHFTHTLESQRLERTQLCRPSNARRHECLQVDCSDPQLRLSA